MEDFAAFQAGKRRRSLSGCSNSGSKTMSHSSGNKSLSGSGSSKKSRHRGFNKSAKKRIRLKTRKTAKTGMRPRLKWGLAALGIGIATLIILGMSLRSNDKSTAERSGLLLGKSKDRSSHFPYRDYSDALYPTAERPCVLRSGQIGAPKRVLQPGQQRQSLSCGDFQVDSGSFALCWDRFCR